MLILRFETFTRSDRTFFIGSLFGNRMKLVLFSRRSPLSSSNRTIAMARRLHFGVKDWLALFMLETRQPCPFGLWATYPERSVILVLLPLRTYSGKDLRLPASLHLSTFGLSWWSTCLFVASRRGLPCFECYPVVSNSFDRWQAVKE
jgi:hypothetical protein